MVRTNSMKVLGISVERLLLMAGLLLLSFYLAARIHIVLSSPAELNRFWQARETSSKDGAVSTSPKDGAIPDFRLWSPQRIAAYKASLASGVNPPLAVLKVRSINLEVPVLEGTDDFTLNRAVGHIAGTPAPGQHGNVGIAGHRDGFFRGLKDVHDGDAIELITQKETVRYVVDEILIVSPADVFVLRSRPKTSLTLVTCYPFYYVGHAPKRYIVHASIANPVDRPKVGNNLP
jgi:sortase A